VVFQKLEETSVPSNLVPPRGPTDDQPVKEKPFGDLSSLVLPVLLSLCLLTQGDCGFSLSRYHKGYGNFKTAFG
jgi:hypothetical protein